MERITFDDILAKDEAGESVGWGVEVDFLDEEEFLKLTNIQRKFVQAYSFKHLGLFTQAKCYKLASPKDCSAYGCHVASQRMKSHTKVRPFLDRVNKAHIRALGTISDIVLRHELAIAQVKITDYLDDDGLITFQGLKKLPDHIVGAIKEIEIIEIAAGVRKYKLKMYDKGSALNRLEKIEGMFAPDKVEHSGTVVNINAESDPKEAAKLYAEMMKGE